MSKRVMLASIACAVLLSATGCAMPSKPMQDASLYERLGGKPAITAVVDDFVGNVAGDARINTRFAKTDIPRLKAMLVDQICAGTGGPCKYAGRDMATAHEGMNIRSEEFDALVEDLVKSLDKFKVPAREKGELLGVLGPMKGAIVGH
ncbi:MAG TPA: group 1 truncated hemoglobin [Burkholderiaceae bacterium]|nr:group 1 truncated hemoglobin [Burkholderiaceae bacterium]